MAEPSSQTPVTSVKTPGAINTLLRSLLRGTPYRTPDRRRFGPVGEKQSFRVGVYGQLTISPALVTQRQPTRQKITNAAEISSKTKPASTVRRRSDDTPLNTRVPLQVRGQTGSADTTSYADVSRSEEAENNLKELRNKTWRVFRVTPLYNYQKKESDFKYYSSSLSSHVAAETKKGTFIDTTLPGEATIGTVAGFDTGEVDERALLIEIQGQSRNKKEKTVISQCLLFSTDLEYNPLKPSIQHSFTYFPVLLINGPEAISQTVQNWLEVQFDCRVIPMTFTSHELVFMAAMFTGFGEIHKPLELVYQVPSEVEGLSKIDYSTSAQDCIRLWNCIRASEDDTFTSEEANQFISGLESHFYECFSIKLHMVIPQIVATSRAKLKSLRIRMAEAQEFVKSNHVNIRPDLMAMPLATIGTPIAFVGREGKIKFYAKDADNTLKVLRHLTDLALDQIKVL